MRSFLLNSLSVICHRPKHFFLYTLAFFVVTQWCYCVGLYNKLPKQPTLHQTYTHVGHWYCIQVRIPFDDLVFTLKSTDMYVCLHMYVNSFSWVMKIHAQITIVWKNLRFIKRMDGLARELSMGIGSDFLVLYMKCFNHYQ